MQQDSHPRCISAAPLRSTATVAALPAMSLVSLAPFARATAWQAPLRSTFARASEDACYLRRRGTTGQNYLAVLDSLDHDLVNLSADLEAELLTFLHRFAINDGKMRAAIDRDSANDECAGRNFALIGSATATGNFSSRLPADWPKWITGSGVEIEGRFIFDRDGGGFVRAEQSLRREDQGEEKWKK